MNFSFHPEAESELIQAIAYYEEREPGLGLEFVAEVYTSIEKIMAHPFAWPVLENEIRRILNRRFPFGILYAIDGEDLFIVAVMNLHRDPDYWKHRI